MELAFGVFFWGGTRETRSNKCRGPVDDLEFCNGHQGFVDTSWMVMWLPKDLALKKIIREVCFSKFLVKQIIKLRTMKVC